MSTFGRLVPVYLFVLLKQRRIVLLCVCVLIDIGMNWIGLDDWEIEVKTIYKQQQGDRPKRKQAGTTKQEKKKGEKSRQGSQRDREIERCIDTNRNWNENLRERQERIQRMQTADFWLNIRVDQNTLILPVLYCCIVALLHGQKKGKG